MAKRTVLKKVGGKKEMKKMYAWCHSHISTPEAWFWKWEKLLKDISAELGFIMEKEGELHKPRGKPWCQLFNLKHNTGVVLLIFLRRKRRQEGGEISVLKEREEGGYVILNTILTWDPHNHVECKMTIGNQYISSLRDNWATLAGTSS